MVCISCSMSRYLLIFLVIFSTTTYAGSCENFIGKWKSCKVDTPRLNSFERAILNSYIRPYELRISQISEQELRFFGIYKKLLARDEVVHDDIITFGIPMTFFWNELPDGRTAPVLEVSADCVENKIVENIEWANLNELNYDSDYIEQNDRYFRSVYSVDGEYLKRRIISKKEKEDEFKYLGTLRCKRKN